MGGQRTLPGYVLHHVAACRPKPVVDATPGRRWHMPVFCTGGLLHAPRAGARRSACSADGLSLAAVEPDNFRAVPTGMAGTAMELAKDIRVRGIGLQCPAVVPEKSDHFSAH